MGIVLRIEGLIKNFGNLRVLDGIDLELEIGEKLVVLGPSGCGKTTLLRVISGVLKPDSGRVDRNFRRLGYVFQFPNLIPWKNVLENLLFVFDDLERAEAMLEMVGLEGFGRSYPRELSWGMRQRVNLARALMVEPDLLLLDEPFSSLDVPTKFRLMEDILEIQERSNFALLMVTHDISEALRMADRIVVLSSRPSRICGMFRKDESDVESKILELLMRIT